MHDFLPLDFQNLPYQAINALLSLQLTNDAVHLSEKSHRHIFERHSDDYPLCICFMDAIISEPEYVGRTPRQDGNFEMMREASGL